MVPHDVARGFGSRRLANSWWPTPSQLARYGAAVVLTAGSFVLSLELLPTLAGLPAALFVVSATLSTWYGGMKPGLLASALGVIAFDYLFVDPVYAFIPTTPRDLLNLIGFALIEVFVTYVTGFFRRQIEQRDRTGSDLTRLTEELERRASEAESGYRDLSALHEISQFVLAANDPASLAEQCLEHAIRLGPYDLGILRLARPDGMLELVAQRGFREPASLGPLMSNDGNLHGVIRSRSPKWVADIRGTNRYPQMKREGVVSIAVFPVVSNNEVLGLLTLGSRSRHDFAPREVKLLESIALQAGIALQKTRLQTEMMKANEELAHSLSVLSATLESTADGILVTDLTGTRVRFNQKFLEMWRIPKSVVVERQNRAVLAHIRDQVLDPASFDERVGHLFADYDSEAFDVLELKDGRVIERYSYPQRVDGQTVGRVLSFRDVSHRRSIEQRLMRAQRLETAGRIAGQVAHDFNNLLSPMVGFPELIKLQLPPDHRAHHYCDLMIQAAEQMAQINEDLLTMGRRGRFEPVAADLNDIVRQVLDQISAAPPSLVLDLQLAGDLLPVAASPPQLLRMTTNLVANAREAMRDAGTLTLRTSNIYLDEPAGHMERIGVGEYVKLDVVDTGAGIAPEIRERIFDAFFTTRPADQRHGSGLGLSVVQAVAEDHGGYVDVQSEVDQGTTFSVYLPISREAVSSPPPSEIVGGTESILVVDDDPLQRTVARELLGSLGYRVSLARSGEEAVAALTMEPADLLLLDMVMPPGIDGAETFRRVREHAASQRAVLLSGFAQSDRVRVAQKLGAGGFLHKPVTREALATAVRSELDRR